MSAVQLVEKRVCKPWGRRDPPQPWGHSREGDPLGEIWFEDPRGSDPELLVKYLFTSERLSIQVHPDDEAARAAGYRCGKDEAWLILEAEPGATIGLGLTGNYSGEQLREAAIDGSIESLVDWRPVSAGDMIYSPAGTVHAIGAGLTVLEVQQNVDLTYRLYDYGRPRELHLDEGISAAKPCPYDAASFPLAQIKKGWERVDGTKFVLERLSGSLRTSLPAGRVTWLIPIKGEAEIEGTPLRVGSVWLAEAGGRVKLDQGTLLMASCRDVLSA